MKKVFFLFAMAVFGASAFAQTWDVYIGPLSSKDVQYLDAHSGTYNREGARKAYEAIKDHDAGRENEYVVLRNQAKPLLLQYFRKKESELKAESEYPSLYPAERNARWAVDWITEEVEYLGTMGGGDRVTISGRRDLPKYYYYAVLHKSIMDKLFGK
jgi:hypothetical protein